MTEYRSSTQSVTSSAGKKTPLAKRDYLPVLTSPFRRTNTASPTCLPQAFPKISNLARCQDISFYSDGEELRTSKGASSIDVTEHDEHDVTLNISIQHIDDVTGDVTAVTLDAARHVNHDVPRGGRRCVRAPVADDDEAVTTNWILQDDLRRRAVQFARRLTALHIAVPDESGVAAIERRLAEVRRMARPRRDERHVLERISEEQRRRIEVRP